MLNVEFKCLSKVINAEAMIKPLEKSDNSIIFKIIF